MIQASVIPGGLEMTRPCQFQGWFVICRLALAMFNPHTDFEVSMITSYEDTVFSCMKIYDAMQNREIVAAFGTSVGSDAI